MAPTPAMPSQQFPPAAFSPQSTMPTQNSASPPPGQCERCDASRVRLCKSCAKKAFWLRNKAYTPLEPLVSKEAPAKEAPAFRSRNAMQGFGPSNAFFQEPQATATAAAEAKRVQEDETVRRLRDSQNRMRREEAKKRQEDARKQLEIEAKLEEHKQRQEEEGKRKREEEQRRAQEEEAKKKEEAMRKAKNDAVQFLVKIGVSTSLNIVQAEYIQVAHQMLQEQPVEQWMHNWRHAQNTFFSRNSFGSGGYGSGQGQQGNQSSFGPGQDSFGSNGGAGMRTPDVVMAPMSSDIEMLMEPQPRELPICEPEPTDDHLLERFRSENTLLRTELQAVRRERSRSRRRHASEMGEAMEAMEEMGLEMKRMARMC